MPDSTVAPQKTTSIGNAAAGRYGFDQAGGGKRIQYLAVRWDGDKIRGLLWRYADGTQYTVGGYATNAALTDYTFNSEELLKTFKLKDSGYGYRSVRRIEFTTSTGGRFAAGPNGFDNEVDLPVDGALLVGFYGNANVDGFLNSLGLWVGPPHYDLPPIGTPVKAGEGGNAKAGARKFEQYSATSMVRYLGVRWDGDKVRGMYIFGLGDQNFLTKRDRQANTFERRLSRSTPRPRPRPLAGVPIDAASMPPSSGYSDYQLSLLGASAAAVQKTTGLTLHLDGRAT